MNKNTNALRMLGYSANDAGHILLSREGRSSYKHEATAIIRIEPDRDSDRLGELVEKLIAAADEPRALIGRDRSGSVVLLFSSEGTYIGTEIHNSQSPFKLALQSGERFTIFVDHVGSLDISAYTWAKGRSPLDVARGSLPRLCAETGVAVVKAAFECGATWSHYVDTPEQVTAKEERLAKIRAEMAQRDAETPEEREIREDQQLSERGSPDLVASDGIFAGLIVAARQRIAQRAAVKAAAARDAATAARKAASRAKLAELESAATP